MSAAPLPFTFAENFTADRAIWVQRIVLGNARAFGRSHTWLRNFAEVCLLLDGPGIAPILSTERWSAIRKEIAKTKRTLQRCGVIFADGSHAHGPAIERVRQAWERLYGWSVRPLGRWDIHPTDAKGRRLPDDEGLCSCGQHALRAAVMDRLIKHSMVLGNTLWSVIHYDAVFAAELSRNRAGGAVGWTAEETGGPPEAVVRLSDSGTQWVVLCCPRCGKTHWHGTGDVGDDPRDYLGHHVAHCLGGGGWNSYVLVEAGHG